MKIATKPPSETLVQKCLDANGQRFAHWEAEIEAIAFIPFEQCQPLSRDFANIPVRPGIYAIRHKTDGLLYIGKTKSLRGRFSGGHKAFLWAWLTTTAMQTFGLQYRQFLTGRTLRYYWS